MRVKDNPGHSSVTGTSRNDFFPGCFLASGFLSGKNRRIPIGSYRFQKGPAGDRLENYRNCPKTSDRNPAAKNQSKTARKRSEAAKTGGIRHGNRRNRPAFRGSGNWIDRPGELSLERDTIDKTERSVQDQTQGKCEATVVNLSSIWCRINRAILEKLSVLFDEEPRWPRHEPLRPHVGRSAPNRPVQGKRPRDGASVQAPSSPQAAWAHARRSRM